MGHFQKINWSLRLEANQRKTGLVSDNFLGRNRCAWLHIDDVNLAPQDGIEGEFRNLDLPLIERMHWPLSYLDAMCFGVTGGNRTHAYRGHSAAPSPLGYSHHKTHCQLVSAARLERAASWSQTKRSAR